MTKNHTKQPTHCVYAGTKAEGAGIRRRCRRTRGYQLSLFLIGKRLGVGRSPCS